MKSDDASSPKWLTPPQFARQLGVSSEKVLLWIRNGELRAVNVADRMAGRPRWRLSPEAIEEFLRRRQSTAPAAPQPQARRTVSYRSPPTIRPGDRRLTVNIPHETKVKRMAIQMAARRSGWGAAWRSFVKTAVERYAEKTGVRVTEEAVAALKAWWEE